MHTGISLFLLFLLSILTDAHAHEKIYRIFPFLLIIWFLTKNLVMCFSIIKWAKASDAITLYKAVSDYKWLCFKLVVIHGFIKLKKVLAFLAAVLLDSRDLFKLHVNQIIQNAIQRFFVLSIFQASGALYVSVKFKFNEIVNSRCRCFCCNL